VSSKWNQEHRYYQRRLCQLSLLEFGKRAFVHVHGSEYVHGRHFDVLARHLQACAKKDDPVGHIGRLLVNLPPSAGKSYFTSIIFVPWIWTWNPGFRALYFSYNQSRALDDSVLSRDLIRCEWYQSLFGDVVQISQGADQKSAYKTTAGGERVVSYPGGPATGKHPDGIVIDDPISADKIHSFAEREKQRRWYFETLQTRGVGREAFHVVVQQRLHVEDLSGHILDHDKELKIAGKPSPWHHVMLPLRYDSSNVMPNRGYGGEWRQVEGELVYPEYLTAKKLETLENSISAAGGTFAADAQLQQKPTRRDGTMFKCSKINTSLMLADFPKKFDRIIRYWDLAASEEGQGCFSAGVLLGFVGAPTSQDLKVYVLDVQHVQKEPDELDDLIEITCKLDWITWRDEDSEGQQILQSYFEKGTSDTGKRVKAILERRFLAYNMNAAAPQKDKVTRAEPLSKLIATGCFYIPADALWKARYLAEFETFPSGKFKDQVDGTSGGVMEYLNPSIKRSTGMALPTKSGELVKFSTGNLGQCKNPHCKRPAFGVNGAEGYCCDKCKESAEWGEACEKHDPACVVRFTDWWNKNSKD
jgi:predicted phage terminase large subunit-like protein